MAAENIPTSTIQYANHACAIGIGKLKINLITISVAPELIPATMLIHQSKNIGWIIWNKLDKPINTTAEVSNTNDFPRKYLNNFIITLN